MNSIFPFIASLLTAALSLLGLVQQHPELSQASRDQAQQVAQQVITQATNVLATSALTTTSASLTASPASGSAPLTVTFNGMLSTSNPSASGGLGVDEPYITFGDDTPHGTLVFCANTPSDVTNYVYPTSCTFIGISHTYAKPGTYSAVLHLGEQKGTLTTLGTTTITVQ